MFEYFREQPEFWIPSMNEIYIFFSFFRIRRIIIYKNFDGIPVKKSFFYQLKTWRIDGERS